MLNMYDEFFLGHNVNEPVAIEIPVRVKNIEELGSFLAKLGFEITYDGTEKGKILIDKTRCDEKENVETYSIITPALNPQDRIQFYSVLKDAIEEYIKICKDYGEKIQGLSPNMFYPHLLDLKHLVADNNNIGRDEYRGNEIERILDELEKSGEAHQIKPEDLYFSGPLGTPNNTKPENYFHGDTAELFPRGYLYNGSAIPDPYGVSTGFNSRFIRFATTNPKYAVSLAGVDHVKTICGYRNISPKGGRYIGFIYQYQYNQSDQLRFGNAGIEQEEQSFNSETFDNETAVNRFDNPCVGIYLMWADVYNPKHYYVYKIDENDPRYQIIKDYYKPANPKLNYRKRERFETWNSEGENHETYMPVRDGKLEQINARKQAEAERIRAERERLESLQIDINKISGQIFSVDLRWLHVSTPTNEEDILYVLKHKEVIAKAEQKGKDTLAILNEIKQQLDALRAEVANNEKLKAKYMEKIEEKVKDWKEKKDEYDACLRNLGVVKSSTDGTIKLLIKKYSRVKEYVDPDSFEKLPLEIRKEILNLFLEKDFVDDKEMQIMAGRILRLYALAPDQDKVELFDLLYKIREKVPSYFRRVIKKNIGKFVKNEDDEKVLTELFSRDGWIIKHTERARKLMALRMGTANVKRKMEEMANARQAIAENDSRDM